MVSPPPPPPPDPFLAHLKSITQNFAPLSSTTLVEPVNKLSDRVAWVTWSGEVCKTLQLGPACHEFGLLFFDYLSGRFKNEKHNNAPDVQMQMAAALIVACKELTGLTESRRIASLINIQQTELLEYLVEEIEFYILPKFRQGNRLVWTSVSSQAKEMEIFLPRDEEWLQVWRFLLELRLALFDLIRLPNRLQLLVCLCATEVILERRISLTWKALLGVVHSDLESAMLRKYSKELYELMLKLNWAAIDRWPAMWFSSRVKSASQCNQILRTLFQLEPLSERLPWNCSSNIWLLAPSVILEP